MGRLLKIFVELCLLRARPQDLPASGFLLLVTVLLGLLTGTLAILEAFGWIAALTAQLVDTLVLLGLLKVVLGLAGRSARFLQTGTALCGTGVLINLASMPVQLMISSGPSTGFKVDLGILVSLILIVWALAVVGHIVRHAFDLPLWAGVITALGYFLTVNWLVQGIFTLS